MIKITSYRDAEFPLLLEQYRNSSRLKDLIGASFDQADQLEIALFEIRDSYYLYFAGLASAEGKQLDTIGKIYGESRNSRTDTAYRDAIQIRAAARLSGTADDIIFAVTALMGGDINQTEFTTEYPAAFSLRTNAQISDAVLAALAPAGVGVGRGDFLAYLEGSTLQPILDQTNSYIYVITQAG